MGVVGLVGRVRGGLRRQRSFQIPSHPGGPGGANPPQATGFGASGFGQPAPGQTGSQQGAPPTGTNAGQTVPGAPGSNAVSADDAANATPSGLASDAPVIGGNIIGVGSKVNKRSIIVYDKATNYRLFEFIWNPSKDLANAINQQVNGPNQNPQGIGPGQTGCGQSGLGQSGFGQSGFGQQNTPPANQPGPPTAAPPPPQNPPQQ